MNPEVSKLPPLPESTQFDCDGLSAIGAFTADQMRSYALAALSADREGEAKDAERYRWLTKTCGKSKDELLAFVLQRDPDAAIDAAIAASQKGEGNG